MDVIGRCTLVMQAVALMQSWNKVKGEILDDVSCLMLWMGKTSSGLKFLQHHARDVQQLAAVFIPTVEGEEMGVEAFGAFRQRMESVMTVLDFCRCLQQVHSAPVESAECLVAVAFLEQVPLPDLCSDQICCRLLMTWSDRECF